MADAAQPGQMTDEEEHAVQSALEQHGFISRSFGRADAAEFDAACNIYVAVKHSFAATGLWDATGDTVVRKRRSRTAGGNAHSGARMGVGGKGDTPYMAGTGFTGGSDDKPRHTLQHRRSRDARPPAATAAEVEELRRQNRALQDQLVTFQSRMENAIREMASSAEPRPDGKGRGRRSVFGMLGLGSTDIDHPTDAPSPSGGRGRTGESTRASTSASASTGTGTSTGTDTNADGTDLVRMPITWQRTHTGECAPDMYATHIMISMAKVRVFTGITALTFTIVAADATTNALFVTYAALEVGMAYAVMVNHSSGMNPMLKQQTEVMKLLSLALIKHPDILDMYGAAAFDMSDAPAAPATSGPYHGEADEWFESAY